MPNGDTNDWETGRIGVTTERMVEGTFRKCDMHVHSSSCYSRTYDKQSFFMEVLDSDLDVLAVTDHNVIDVPLLEELHQLMKARGKTLFAGVEVNVRLRQETIDAYHLVLGKGSKGSYFHAIILLSPDQAHAMADIVENLFVPVILSGSGDTTLTEERLRKMPRREFSKHTKCRTANC